MFQVAARLIVTLANSPRMGSYRDPRPINKGSHLPDPGPRPERRQLSRFQGIGSPITFTAAPAEIVTGKILNISVVGIGILCGRYFAAGTTVAIHVPAFSGRPLTYLSAVIKHAAAQEDGSWVLGCMLLRPLEIDEILALG